MKLDLSSLPKLIAPRKKRLGRGAGSGKGAKSGRGTTRHQAARENIPLHFEGGQGKMTKKYPMLRGKGKNKSVQTRSAIITLTQLNTFKDGDIVDMAALQSKNMAIGGNYVRVKVLQNGTLERKLQVKLPVSQSVKQAIEKAGGTVTPV